MGFFRYHPRPSRGSNWDAPDVIHGVEISLSIVGQNRIASPIVRAYTYIYDCMYACMYVCMYACMYACMSCSPCASCTSLRNASHVCHVRHVRHVHHVSNVMQFSVT